MDKNIIKYIIGFFISGMLIVACSNETEISKEEDKERAPIELDIDTKSLPGDLECDMYVFCRKGTSDPYVFRRIVTLKNKINTVDFSNDSLTTDYSYRFLFVAVPPKYKDEISIKHTTKAKLDLDDEWKDLLFEANKENISDQLHYGIILSKTGKSILDDGKITVSLGRLVGQQVINIYKIHEDKEGIKAIDVSPNVLSVLDRVDRIDIKYTGVTKNLTFAEDGTIIEGDTWPDFTQTIIPKINETTGADLLKVELPQTKDSIATFVDKSQGGKKIKGSARINGYFGLPATKKIRIQATMSYYHTTPILCDGTDAGDHTKDCFRKKTLVLNLPPDPQDPLYPLLSTISNTYTMNKARLRFDRVIDVGANGDFVFETTWD